MKEFRVAKCLVDGEINEYAIFADGSRKKIIQTNDKYGKYFEVDNELNTDCKSFLRFSYSGRIKDAVEMIRNGNGDCISSMKYVGRIDNVLYFLDRQIGEELRQKSLEGWKDTKFGWVIECGNKNSFSGYSMLNKKKPGKPAHLPSVPRRHVCWVVWQPCTTSRFTWRANGTV